MTTGQDLSPILRRYPDPLPQGRLEPLGTGGGFSGARLWRLAAPDRTWCVRRWPAEHPDPVRLHFIHRCLRHVAAEGCDFVPVPLDTRDGDSFVAHGGHLWQVEPWLSGSSNYDRQPTSARLRGAMGKLAQFHMASGTLDTSLVWNESPGLAEREQLIQHVEQREYHLLEQRLQESPSSDPLRRPGLALLALFPHAAAAVARQLRLAGSTRLPLQPCIRDIWHGNVLFEGDEITGFVDFGSMRIETVAADIARLLGSMAADDQHRWGEGLQAYESIRPLLDAERDAITSFDRSGVLLSGLNWLRWIYLERRDFEDLDAVRVRLESNLQRLAHLHDRL